jgi:hypothetical protein
MSRDPLASALKQIREMLHKPLLVPVDDTYWAGILIVHERGYVTTSRDLYRVGDMLGVGLDRFRVLSEEVWR